MDLIGLLTFALVISVVVGIHEFGHLMAAKWCGVYCHEFSIGFGPKIFSFKGKETQYSLRALPLGGYVKMAGEDDDETSQAIPVERTIKGISSSKKIFVMLAGILMNFLLFLVIMVPIIHYQGLPSNDEATTQIQTVQPGSASDKAGLMAQDRIIAIHLHGKRHEVETYKDLSLILNQVDEPTIHVDIDRQGQVLTKEVVYDKTLEAPLGIGFTTPLRPVSWVEALGQGLTMIVRVVGSTFGLILSLFKGQGFDQVTGPVGIYRITQSVAHQGGLALIQLVGILSVSVGALNLIPIPVMDGGRVFLTLIEVILGRPLSKSVEEKIMMGSAILMVILLLLVLYKDLFL